MNKEVIFNHKTEAAYKHGNFITGNFMSMTLIYSTLVFILNVITILTVFK